MSKHIDSTFKPCAQVKFANSTDEFLDVINGSPKNEYLLYDEEDKTCPLPGISVDDRYPPKKYFYIQAEDGEIIAAKTLRESPNNSEVIWSMGTAVHPDHRNQGYSKSLIHAAMQYVTTLGRIYAPSDFSDDGWDYLANVYSELHRDFPSLRILYSDDESDDAIKRLTVTGEQPYKLERRRHGCPEVIIG